MAGRVLPFPVLNSHRFQAIATEHEGALQMTALRLCGNPSDALDLVQDTLERGFRAFARFRPDTNARAWLFTILHNLFIDRCRAKRRESIADLAPERVEEIAAPNVEPLPTWAQISTAQVRAALEQISSDFRVVYELHTVEGRSYSEIAALLRVPKATVGTRLIRARRRLKEILLPDDEAGEK